MGSLLKQVFAGIQASVRGSEVVHKISQANQKNNALE